MAGTDADNLVALVRLSIDALPFTDEAVAEWYAGMQDAISRGHSAAVISGAARASWGGRVRQALNRLLPSQLKLNSANQALLRRRLSEQLTYLNRFRIEYPYLSEAERAARSRMYAGAVRGTVEMARWSHISLPVWPTVGTQCMSNCRCSWSVNERTGVARWVRGSGDSCSTCVSREARYSAVVIRKAA